MINENMVKKRFGVLDLFCGAGGLSSGFEGENFDILLGIDFFKSSLDTFQANHPNSKTLFEDISKVGYKDIKKIIGNKKIDVIIGGPPCQGFSMAGKRQPNDPRNSLFREYLRLIKEIKPTAFVMENVRGLLSMKNENGKLVKDIILEEFESLKDYKVELKSVNTANYGVPQRRQRIFFVGIKRKYSFEFPKETHNQKGELGLKKWANLKKIILKKEKVPKKYFYSKKLIEGFKRRERKNKERKMGFGWQFLDLEKPSYTISARYWKDGAESLVKYDNSFKEGSIRMLTPKECALIQSFPKAYKFKGTEKEIYQQIGNAVPPLMAKNISKSIYKALS